MTRLVPELFAALPRAAGRPLPAAAARRAARGRARRRGRGDRRRLDAGPAELAPTSSTRSSRARWASSWSRRPTSSSATTSCYMRTTARPAARARDLPPPRRRLHRPARVPPRLACSACPGLMRAYRAGTVAIANAHRHRRRRRQGDLPLRAGDDPLLPRRGADPRQRPDLPAGRPRAARGGAGAAATSSSSSRPASPAARASSSARHDRARQLDGARRRDPRASPSAGSPRSSCNLSTVPTAMPDGALAPRHVDLRPFAVFGETIRIVPGGLTRVALTRGLDDRQLLAGGGSKDTWVLEDGDGRAPAAAARRAATRSPPRCPTCATAALVRPAAAAAAAATR